MSAEKIKMMNRSKELNERISKLSREKINAENEKWDMRYHCQHEIIAVEKSYKFATCIFCGNTGFSDWYLEKSPKVIRVPKLEKEGYDEMLERVRKAYK